MKYYCMNCNSEFEPKNDLIKCGSCGHALWVKPEIKKFFTKDDLIKNDFTMWRYAKAYPLNHEDITVTFNETMTPLAKACVSEDSSGNGGSAYAGYAAKAGIDCNIYVPANTSLGKVVQTRIYGAQCIEVEGERHDVADQAMTCNERDNSQYVGHNWHPLFIEGVKSIAYEIWEQCDYCAPDNFVAPAGNGSILAGAYLGFSELLTSGQIERMPRIFGIQNNVVKPFVEAYNGEEVNENPGSDTIAEGIKIKRSSRHDEVLSFVKETNGAFIAVDDAEIKQALFQMGAQGFFIEPTSATAFAGINALIKSGHISEGEVTVGVVTGHGLKANNKLQNLLTEQESENESSANE
ncbi:threonine synthase [Vibrio mediterranei]|uniref:threonine synthase n=1 Tax=Vibrio mediterranei TaxID=689 RepID=UPI00148D11D9|nr:pyridoxal-phosphate dependent enzyme [Vibrio mediterranei]NOI26662.1 pyridoxal-phosphate dependent enzyme [Vibrio mediterranei]